MGAFDNQDYADGYRDGTRFAEVTITALRAENEKLRAYALKAFTVVEFCSGEGFLLQYPSYDCDDLLMEGVDLLNVETSEEARAALSTSQPAPPPVRTDSRYNNAERIFGDD